MRHISVVNLNDDTIVLTDTPERCVGKTSQELAGTDDVRWYLSNFLGFASSLLGYNDKYFSLIKEIESGKYTQSEVVGLIDSSLLKGVPDALEAKESVNVWFDEQKGFVTDTENSYLDLYFNWMLGFKKKEPEYEYDKNILLLKDFFKNPVSLSKDSLFNLFERFWEAQDKQAVLDMERINISLRENPVIAIDDGENSPPPPGGGSGNTIPPMADIFFPQPPNPPTQVAVPPLVPPPSSSVHQDNSGESLIGYIDDVEKEKEFALYQGFDGSKTSYYRLEILDRNKDRVNAVKNDLSKINEDVSDIRSLRSYVDFDKEGNSSSILFNVSSMDFSSREEKMFVELPFYIEAFNGTNLYKNQRNICIDFFDDQQKFLKSWTYEDSSQNGRSVDKTFIPYRGR